MNDSSICMVFVILMGEISPAFMQDTSASDQQGLGKSSCVYFGGTMSNCGFKLVSVNDLPDSCTSFLFESVTVDPNHNVHFTYSPDDEAYLKMVCETGKTVYINYGRRTFEDWTSALSCVGTNAVDEAKGLNVFLKAHPGITGLVLRSFEPNSNSKEFPGLTENLLKYIEVMKNETNGLGIGIQLKAKTFMDYYDNKTFSWLDFPTLNDHVNFYLLTLEYFDDCTADLRNTGTAPMTGNTKYTLEKLASAVQKAQIPTEKAVFKFHLKPQSSNASYASSCDSNNEMMCRFPEESKDWCSDTLESYYEKGKWVQRNGVGFVGLSIDLDDPGNACCCGPYPSFNAILAGMVGGPPPPKCALIDRQP